ncbi:uncharacterized protein L201_002710 [Kwoniella dendrophila CBS 6074]|uniref:Uncharacterized protein n=1 Tax=Kwoniella dendrophila CBS 6074 TaxID=1295534 RepID=A0AAX4JSB3_9TREE
MSESSKANTSKNGSNSSNSWAKPYTTYGAKHGISSDGNDEDWKKKYLYLPTGSTTQGGTNYISGSDSLTRNPNPK